VAESPRNRIDITLRGDIDSKGKPLTTGANGCTGKQIVVGELRRIHPQYPCLRKPTLEHPHEVRSIFDEREIAFAMPRANSARVNVPIPAPSSRTGPSDGNISFVIRREANHPRARRPDPERIGTHDEEAKEVRIGICGCHDLISVDCD